MKKSLKDLSCDQFWVSNIDKSFDLHLLTIVALFFLVLYLQNLFIWSSLNAFNSSNHTFYVRLYWFVLLLIYTCFIEQDCQSTLVLFMFFLYDYKCLPFWTLSKNCPKVWFQAHLVKLLAIFKDYLFVILLQ